MRRAAVAIAQVLGVCLVATPLVAVSPQAAQGDPKRPDVVITEADCTKKIRVKRGDLIEVRLMAGLPSYWAQDQHNPILRSKLRFPKSQPAPRLGDLTTLDGRYICLNLFEVVGDSEVPVTLKLMYCAPPTEAERLEHVKPKDPTELAFWTRQRLERKKITPTEFRPDLDVTKLKEGMLFQVAFQTRDELSKVQNAPTGP
jgi:hypothetical protein